METGKFLNDQGREEAKKAVLAEERRKVLKEMAKKDAANKHDQHKWDVIGALGGLLSADVLLIFMCLAGKIELLYGLVFLAGASAFFGYRMK